MTPLVDAIHDGGFRNPVFDAQSVFRRLMDAFAQPGTIASLDGVAYGPGLPPAMAAVLATLCDHETPVFLHACIRTDAAAWLAFHTGATLASNAAMSAFACFPSGASFSFDGFAIGTADYPDRSSTVLLTVESFDGGTALELSGPGIETTRRVRVAGLPQDFVAGMAANRGLFPLGFDLVLVCGSEAMALPRTTRISEVA
ncbi:phosphonate C-P lyase system protein PhnH [Aureimonas altamirensis]|uniref:phosphonate C-P lyase system protein PhnH n=1 Tax=Aureimonas altamirensis TaxID=370622 RepID=UPI0020369358|nr:phosphonate C-P lyase system protein PhnH [Aureimonas altamirensis]MCM2504380.1 phosphonate C-P lyase system protein PhnH [Aureimonas altamirensis]